MEKTTLRLKNKDGLHARPAAVFVQDANKFDSEIEITVGSLDLVARDCNRLRVVRCVKRLETAIKGHTTFLINNQIVAFPRFRSRCDFLPRVAGGIA